MLLKKIVFNSFRFFLGILLLILLYALISLVLSIIPVNNDFENKIDSCVDIYIKSNGIHLDIIVPIRNDNKDWSTEVTIDSTIYHMYKYIGFGWGDKEFYLNTPEWSDLKFSTAFKAMFFLSNSAMHITFHKRPRINKKCKKICVNEIQYKKMVEFIEQSFARDTNENTMIIENVSYGKYDCFYEAKDSYHLFFTCNTWANQCLRRSELPASLWTPFEKGTLFHYRKR